MDDIKTLLIKRQEINKELEKIDTTDYINKKAAEIYGADFTARIVDNVKIVISEIIKGGC